MLTIQGDYIYIPILSGFIAGSIYLLLYTILIVFQEQKTGP